MNCRNCGQALDDASRFCKFCGAPAPEDPDEAAAPIRVGDVLEGKWKIEKKVGQGGMGSVYMAQDTSLDRKVAIKILAPDLCNDVEFVTRFEREAKATANLEHPNVVLVYAVGQHYGRPFIVMKHLEGLSLARHLRQHPQGLSFENTQHIFSQICAGMGFIHSKGFVHRDVKAGNIFIGPDGKATILDLGIVRDTRAKQGLTRVGVIMGTPHYLAPEQALGKEIDHRADLYALGILLYECLTGTPPYQADTARRLIEMHLKQPPPDPCKRLPDLPPEVGRVVRKAIAKRPEARFQTAEEMSEALAEAFAAEQPELEPEPAPEEEPVEEPPKKKTPVRPAGVAMSATAHTQPGPSRDTAETPAPEAHKRSFAFPVVMVLALAAVGGVSWSLIKKEQQEAAATPEVVAKPLEDPTGTGQPPPDRPTPTPPKPPADQSPAGQAKALLDEGLEFAKGKHYDFALGKYLQAEELDAKNPVLMLAMGNAYLGANEPENAIKYFGKATALDPKSGEARAGVARAYVKWKKPREALKELRAMVDAGFKDLSAIEADEELAGLRKDGAYLELKRIAEGGAAPVPVRPRPGGETRPGEEERSDSLVMGATGSLKIVANSADNGTSSVAIDGKPRGHTPLTVELNAGKHTVVIIKQGCKTIRTEVQVPLASTYNLTVDMEKN